MNEQYNTFLFSWNPIKFPWPELSEQIELLKKGGKVQESWTCASHKKVKKGDRAFVSYVGLEPRGLFASGYVSSEPFIGKNRKGNDAYRVLIDFDVLLDPAKEPILTLELLKMGKMEKQLWTPQASGIAIKTELLEELEAVWEDFISSRIQREQV
jgi:5-methylcytosine-specific restriction protein A